MGFEPPDSQACLMLFQRGAANPIKKTSDYPLSPCAQANKPLPLHSLYGHENEVYSGGMMN